MTAQLFVMLDEFTKESLHQRQTIMHTLREIMETFQLFNQGPSIDNVMSASHYVDERNKECHRNPSLTSVEREGYRNSQAARFVFASS